MSLRQFVATGFFSASVVAVLGATIAPVLRQYSASDEPVLRRYCHSILAQYWFPVLRQYSDGTVIQYWHRTGPVLIPGIAPVLKISTEWRYHAKVPPVLRQYSLVPPVLEQYYACCKFPLGMLKVKGPKLRGYSSLRRVKFGIFFLFPCMSKFIKK